MSFNRKNPTRVVEVKVEPAAELEWRNDHGPACCCMTCVLARAAKREAKARAFMAWRKGPK